MKLRNIHRSVFVRRMKLRNIHRSVFVRRMKLRNIHRSVFVRRIKLRLRLVRKWSCALVIALVALPGAGCSTARDAELTQPEKTAIADSLKKLVVSAYDLSKPDPVASLMSLYPDDSLVSASAGSVVRTRAQLEEQVRTFWTYVGSNMQKPKWVWTSMTIDVLSPDAATMTSTYQIPHTTPQGRAHLLGGAWTAVFARRGGRWVIVQEHLSDAPSSP